MVIRRSDQRRRRVVLEEAVQNPDEPGRAAPGRTTAKAATDGKDSADSRAYTFGAHRRGQKKTTDLLPKRFVSFGLVVMVILSCIGLLNLAAVQVGNIASYVGDSGQEVFAITGSGTLSSWFSSFLLIITGLASLQIYALRQHRCDDYRGTYRLWLWMSALFLLASMNCVVDLGQVASNIASAFTQQSLQQSVWPLITLKLLALSLLVARGLFEIRESRGAAAMVVLVWVAYTAAIAMQIPAVKDSMVINFESCYGNLLLFGNALLFLSHLVYARFVFLHAHGLITLPLPKESTNAQPVVKKKRKKKRRPTTSDSATDETNRSTKPATTKKRSKKAAARPPVPKPTVSSAPPARAPVPKPSQPTPVPQAVDLSPEDMRILSLDANERNNLSKSERRRLKKLEKRNRRAA